MEFMHWLFFGPSKLIAWHPYAGFIVGATLLAVAVACALQLSNRLDRQWFRQPAVLAGLLWSKIQPERMVKRSFKNDVFNVGAYLCGDATASALGSSV